MTRKTRDTFTIDIFMAGSHVGAKHICAGYCMEVGLCVTVTPTTYVYTGGEEEGFIVGLRHYPRFPTTMYQLMRHADALAERLISGLHQHSAMLVSPGTTTWVFKTAPK